MRALVYRALDALGADDRLETLDRLVVLHLIGHARPDGSGVTVSLATLAAEAHVSERTVKRAVRNLVAHGWITRTRRRETSALTTVRIPGEETPEEGTHVSHREGTHVSHPEGTYEVDSHPGGDTGVPSGRDKRGRGKGHPFPPNSIEQGPSRFARGWERPPAFVPPELGEVEAEAAAMIEAGGLVGLEAGAVARSFLDHFAAVGWRVGRSPLVDWRARLRRWVREDAEGRGPRSPSNGTGRERQHVGASPCSLEADGWLCDTVRTADRDQHQDDPAWSAYADAAAGLPPRTAPTFAAWMATRAVPS